MISTAINTYNHAPYIGQAIESALMQSVDCDYEIVVSDDCSTDGTQGIIRDFHRRHPQIIRPVLRKKNCGDSGKTNFTELFKHCRGHYIAYLDGDDYWTSPNKLRKQHHLMEQHPEWAVCFHTVRTQQADGEYRVFRPPGKKTVYTYPDLLLHSTFIPSGSVMYRAGLIDRFPEWFYDHRIIGDIASYLLHARRGDVGFLDEVLGVYRQHPGGYWSQQKLIDQIDKANAMCHLMKEVVANRYVPILNRRILRQTACYHSINGNQQAARDCIRRYIQTSPFPDGLVDRDFVLAFMAVYCPTLLRWLLKKTTTRSARTDRSITPNQTSNETNERTT